MLRISFHRTSEHDWHERLSSSNWVFLIRQGLYNTTTLPSDGCLIGSKCLEDSFVGYTAKTRMESGRSAIGTNATCGDVAAVSAVGSKAVMPTCPAPFHNLSMCECE